MSACQYSFICPVASNRVRRDWPDIGFMCRARSVQSAIIWLKKREDKTIANCELICYNDIGDIVVILRQNIKIPKLAFLFWSLWTLHVTGRSF